MLEETSPELLAPDLSTYDRILVAFSGGKDSLACLLHLFELGVPKDRIELHHHLVDGGSSLMDWPVTEAYCRAVAKALGVPLYFSWKQGGFLAEMTRDNAPTAPIMFERPDDVPATVGGQGPLGTRKQFPQVSADLKVRWCSAYLKIDVLAALIRNDARFEGKRLVVITGERAEESSARARYARFERHRSDLRDGQRKRRHVDAWRPVHHWSREQVWAIIRRHGVVPHPAYYLGWSRLSCMCCIFGSKNQWATINLIAPRQFQRIGRYEQSFRKTIHRSRSVAQQAADGTPYPAARANPQLVEVALSSHYDLPVLCHPDDWQLPSGAYGEDAGPT